MRKIGLYFALLCLVAGVQAQNTSSGYYVELGSGIGTSSLNDSKTTLATRDVFVSFGYDLSNRFTVKLPLTLSSGMFKTENAKLYETSGAVGLGVGYNFAVKPDYRWQLAVEAGNTLNGKENGWRYFYYDASGKLYIGAPENRINGILGLGIRQFVPNAKNSVDYLTPYITIGLRLNHFKHK